MYILFSKYRKYNKIYDKLRGVDLEEITELTSCMKPCRYNKYGFLTDGQPTIFESENYVFSLWATSKYTKVSTEQLIYPMTSLVAEFGGALSLFLGISFMSIWDNLCLFGLVFKLVFNKH